MLHNLNSTKAPTYYKSKFTAESDYSAVKTIQDKTESTSIKALDGEQSQK